MLNSPQKTRYEGLERRLKVVVFGLVVAMAVLVAQLARLQIAQGGAYADMAKNRPLRSHPLKAQRGIIYGPNESVILANNRAACDLFILPKDCEDHEEEVCALLAELVAIDGDELLAKLKEHSRKPFTHIRVKEDISRQELTQVGEWAYALPGVFTVVRPLRRYLHGRTAGQILGFINEISAEELKTASEYHMGDLVGRRGLEQAYEPKLRGVDGNMVVSVYRGGAVQRLTDMFGNPLGLLGQGARDQQGRKVTVERHDPPISGGAIFTTLDIELQAKAESLLEGERGAIVVLDADTGAVYALASVPGYDPNVFVDANGAVRDADGISPRERVLNNLDKLKRMRHRAFQEQYPPGSIFKVMMAVAGLEEGVINEHTTFYCPGRFSLGNTRWYCWQHGGHGNIAVVNALAYSCDVFFYNVGLELGVNRIKQWGGRMGLGIQTGLDLPGEIEACVPTPEWKEAARSDLGIWDRQWQKGDTVNLAIGQGYCTLTPLQCAVMMAVIVNGGYRVTPFLNRAVQPQLEDLHISPETMRIVREGMRKCITKHDYPSGTGWRADIPGMHVLGKTGSAQIVPRARYAGMKEKDIPYGWRDHAWFIAGVLDREPRIAVCVLFEHGLHGGSGASPLARELLEFFYERHTPLHRQMARMEARE